MDKRYAVLMVVMNVILAIFTFLMYQNSIAINNLRGLAYSECETFICRFNLLDNVTTNRTVNCSNAKPDDYLLTTGTLKTINQTLLRS